MSASNLARELEDAPVHEPLDWIAFSARLNEEFSVAANAEERSALLAARAVAVELVVRQLGLQGDDLEKFTDACEMEYKRLIVRETLVDGVVSYDEMLRVTDREIAAGRMSEDYALRAMAIEERTHNGHLDTSTAGDELRSRTGKFAKLKHWLHID
jgi:hypothetical protein